LRKCGFHLWLPQADEYAPLCGEPAGDAKWLFAQSPRNSTTALSTVGLAFHPNMAPANLDFWVTGATFARGFLENRG